MAVAKRERRKHPRPWDGAVLAWARRGSTPLLPATVTIPGAPRTKKNGETPMMVGGRKLLLPSAAYRGYERASVPALVAAWRHAPIDVPVSCRALIYRAKAEGDANNFYGAIADILEEAGIVADDKLVTSWDGSRVYVDKHRPRVEVWLTPADAHGNPLPFDTEQAA